MLEANRNFMLEGIDIRKVKYYWLISYESYDMTHISHRLSEIGKIDNGVNSMTFYEIYLQGFIRLQYDT